MNNLVKPTHNSNMSLSECLAQVFTCLVTGRSGGQSLSEEALLSFGIKTQDLRNKMLSTEMGIEEISIDFTTRTLTVGWAKSSQAKPLISAVELLSPKETFIESYRFDNGIIYINHFGTRTEMMPRKIFIVFLFNDTDGNLLTNIK